MRFVPSALLQGRDLRAMGLDEFLRYVAKARYVEEIETHILAAAISEVFGAE